MIINALSPTSKSQCFSLALTGDMNVIGKFNSQKVLVCASGWCDYVFVKNYKLRPLMDLEKYISENNHLPGIPSASEVENSNVDIFEMQKMQMEKIEELTLYLIELKKENEEIKTELKKLKK
jgi:hypothetical protein